MSDRDDLDTLDIDPAFDRLAADVDSHTRARGAEGAIRSARNRRLAGAGGTLAVVVLLAGVLLGPLGLPAHQSVAPAATPMSDPLPEPRTFDAAAFNEATAGWTSGWTEGAPPVPTDLPCALDPDVEIPKPLDTSSTDFRADRRIGATHRVERFDTSERARDRFVAQASGSCPGQEIKELPDEIWIGGESLGYGIKNRRQSFYEINVLHETEVVILTVAGVAGVAGVAELPEDVRQQIVFALLADLRS